MRLSILHVRQSGNAKRGTRHAKVRRRDGTHKVKLHRTDDSDNYKWIANCSGHIGYAATCRGAIDMAMDQVAWGEALCQPDYKRRNKKGA